MSIFPGIVPSTRLTRLMQVKRDNRPVDCNRRNRPYRSTTGCNQTLNRPSTGQKHRLTCHNQINPVDPLTATESEPQT